MSKPLKKLEENIESFKEYFIKKYFGSSKNIEHYWISDEIGGVLSVADYFFSLNDMVEFVRNRYTPKKMFEYYDYALTYNMKDKHKKGDYLINIKNYNKLK